MNEQVARGIAANDRAIAHGGVLSVTEAELRRRVRDTVGTQELEELLKGLEVHLTNGAGLSHAKLVSVCERLRPLTQQVEIESWVLSLFRCLRGWERLSMRNDTR